MHPISKTRSLGLAAATLVLVPLLMCAEEWLSERSSSQSAAAKRDRDIHAIDVSTSAGASEAPEVIRVNGIRMRPGRTLDASGRIGEGTSVDEPIIEDPFPTVGDAPGTDDPLVPRPDGSRRLLTAIVEGKADYVRVYASSRSAVAIRAELKSKMLGLDWQLIQSEGEHMTWGREGLDLLITVVRDESGGTQVVAVASPRDAHVRARLETFAALRIPTAARVVPVRRSASR